MKRITFFTLVIFGLVLVLSGCQHQSVQLGSENLGEVKKVKTEDGVETTQKTLISPDKKVVRETEVKIKKPADVDKVIEEVDKVLDEVDPSKLDLDL